MVSKTKRKPVASRSPSLEGSSDDSTSSAASGSREFRQQRHVDYIKPKGGSSSSSSNRRHQGESRKQTSPQGSGSSSLPLQAGGETLSNSAGHSSTAKQSLLMVGVFAVGLFSGVGYVGLVQNQYGYGRDAAMEQRYLPFGPVTAGACLDQRQGRIEQQQELAAAEAEVLARSSQPSTFVPTLFGMNYHQLVGQPKSSAPMDANTGTAGDKEQASQKQHRQQPSAEQQHGISSDLYRLATTREVSLAPSEVAMIQSVAKDVHANIPNLKERAMQVSWGGPHRTVPETHWWFPEENNNNSDLSDLSKLEGGHLLYAYLYIMKWNPNPHFPFRLCGETGCPPERAVAHSLEWREKYKPWLVPPSVLEENKNGYVYHRGFSPIIQNSDGSSASAGKHGTVFVRLNHSVKDDVSFFRGILHSADQAIADALVESNGEVGKFNVIFDCQGFSLGNAPSRHALKQGVTMLQDHFANRLGMIFLAQLPRVGEIFLRVVLGLITKEVRDKIKILPNHDKAKSLAILKMVLEEESIPDYMGGTDTYRFDVESYYPLEVRGTEEEAREFLTTMPYHAK